MVIDWQCVGLVGVGRGLWVSAELEDKLLRRKEYAAAERLRDGLVRIRGGEFHGNDRVVDEWVGGRIAETNRTDSTPAISISADADRDALSNWVEALLGTAGIGHRFYLFTAQRFFAWLDCEVWSVDWGSELIEVSPTSVVVVSPDLSGLGVIHEGEHMFDGFTFRRPA